ncbi:DUF5068 domain-containing protein [Rossellomorea marisflavi]|uniref:DUF5068 domain-containing protein n=1 Tax=Rossellomorea marisflavi TaxID=189381 RepID=UPI0028534641|nr:DUF5068 domain-containing protein [Rossellomorea marisflavi]MDR4937980.1 DUF5068 domain-containing protein [Rossellomorea marisflavi]
MSKKWISIMLAVLVAFAVSGCGQADEKASGDGKKEETKKEESKKKDSGNQEFSDLITFMEKETGGSAKKVFENTKPEQEYETEGIKVSLDQYQVLELNGLDEEYRTPFKKEEDGAVVLAKYTLKNESDQDVYYNPTLNMTFSGADKSYDNYRELLPEDKQIKEMLTPDNEYLWKKGETITGYYTYTMSKGDLEKAMDVSTVAIEVPAAQAEKDDYNSLIGEKGIFNVGLTEAGVKKVADNKKFYQDLTTKNDLGEKVMVDEKEGIGTNEKIGDLTFTLEGYQFAEFTPNAVEAPKFSNFKGDMVLLTVKLQVENGGKEQLSQGSPTSKLLIDGGADYTLDQPMLTGYAYDDVIEPGESGELLQIFVLDKEKYEKIWKDKSFEMEIAHLQNAKAKELFEGKTVSFKLK